MRNLRIFYTAATRPRVEPRVYKTLVRRFTSIASIPAVVVKAVHCIKFDLRRRWEGRHNGTPPELGIQWCAMSKTRI